MGGQLDAFRRKPVQVGRQMPGFAVIIRGLAAVLKENAQIAPPQIIGENVDDVWLGRHRRQSGTRCKDRNGRNEHSRDYSLTTRIHPHFSQRV
jgi:hypothetical protein